MISLKRWIHKLKNHLIIKLGGWVDAPIRPRVIIQPVKIDALKATRLIPREMFQLYPTELWEKEVFDELSKELIKQVGFKFNEEHDYIRCEATIMVVRMTEDAEKIVYEGVKE